MQDTTTAIQAKYATVQGYWKDDKNKSVFQYQVKLENSFHDDDELVFYFFEDEEELKEAMKPDGGFEFLILNYKIND